MTDRRRRLGALVVAVAMWLGAAPGAQAPDPNAVRQRLMDYLTRYEPQLSALVAEERFTQWPNAVHARGYQQSTGIDRDITRPRTLVSDVAFVSLPGNAGWLGYRDVKAVNGRAVKRSGLSLEELLGSDNSNSRERAMALLLEGARHNLGAPRTINLPSLPLELLHRRNEGRFVITGSYHDRTGGCDALRLDLEETVRPTLIQRPQGGDMPSRVAAWIEPASGRLCRAEVRTRDSQLGAYFEALVRVDFTHDPELDMMVPARLYEVFFDPPRNKGDGEAAYSHYRRVVRPPPRH